jgi:hypothetical protein
MVPRPEALEENDDGAADPSATLTAARSFIDVLRPVLID